MVAKRRRSAKYICNWVSMYMYMSVSVCLSVCMSVCLYVCLSLCMLAFYFFYRFQELDLSTEALLTKESNREEMWIDLVEGSLKQVGNFDKVSTILSIHQFIYLYIH